MEFRGCRFRLRGLPPFAAVCSPVIRGCSYEADAGYVASDEGDRTNADDA